MHNLHRAKEVMMFDLKTSSLLKGNNKSNRQGTQRSFKVPYARGSATSNENWTQQRLKRSGNAARKIADANEDDKYDAKSSYSELIAERWFQ